MVQRKKLAVIFLILILGFLLESCVEKPEALEKITAIEVNNEKQQVAPKQGAPIETTNIQANASNHFFFNDFSREYIYNGTAWKPDSTEDHNVSVIARIEKLAILKTGAIYLLHFKMTNANERQEDMKMYLWVTENTIYQLFLEKSEDAMRFEKQGVLPSVEQSNVRCQGENMAFDEGPWHTEINTQTGVCTYQNTHNSGHFNTMVWEAGKGLVKYSQGYGAHREGFDLHLEF